MSSSIRRNRSRARGSSTEASPTTRSASCQRTAVPASPGISRRSAVSWLTALRSLHSEDRTTTSRSHCLIELTLALRLATVRRRHWEKEAVFSPSPKRPKSVAARTSRGLCDPARIASFSSASVIPDPSSRTRNQEREPAQWQSIQTLRAPALRLLSTRSAIAAGVEYPKARSDSISASGFGDAMSKSAFS